MSDRLLKPSVVAEMLAVHPVTVYRWFWEGKLRGIKQVGVRGAIRIFEGSVKKMLQEREE